MIELISVQQPGENACRKAVAQRSGAPGDVRSPADGHKQAGFTPAVKRNARRAGLEPVKCVRGGRDVAAELFLQGQK